jgi:hypothetical protein
MAAPTSVAEASKNPCQRRAVHTGTEGLAALVREVSRAESFSADQLLLGLEDVEQTEAEIAAEADATSATVRTATARKRPANGGVLSPHLQRIETIVDVESKICSCCCGELHRIGEDASEKLDIALWGVFRLDR